MRPLVFSCLLALLASCRTTTGSELPGSSPWTDAAGRVEHPELAALSVDLWEEMLAADPIEATRDGDARYHALLPDVSPEGRARRRVRLLALSERAASLDPQGLSPRDLVTLEMARDELDKALALHDAGLHLWLVSPGRGVHTVLLNLAPDQPASTPAEQAALVQRWAAMPAYVDQVAANLRRGRAQGLVATQSAIAATVEQLDELLAQDVGSWPLATPAISGLSDAERQALEQQLAEDLQAHLRPALVRLRDTLRDELLPAARDDDAPGLLSLPGGEQIYERLIAYHTGLSLTAEQINAIGREQVASVRAEIGQLGLRLFGTSEMAAIQQRLRSDPELFFATREQVQRTAELSLQRAQAGMSSWFGRLPLAPCEVIPMAAHEEQHSTIAYYRPPAADGSRPGRYVINTFAPQTRPRFDAEVLAFHEAIPGHHLQIAIANELEGVPRFQRRAGSTAFVEGWALYTERLCDEMDLYTSDLDRLGMLSFDAWRACRLVVDTGLHSQGMSRDEAIAYMLENTLLEPNNVVNEVDRYIANPGQALAYKLGQLEIRALRQQAQQALGEHFQIQAFHDVVLGQGAVTLPILRRQVEAWIEASAPGA